MSTSPKPITIDFETEAIERRPQYPPKPVGFSIKHPGEKKFKYFAWGHPTENNCTKETAKRVLLGAWRSGEPLLFQNGKFDVDVAEEHMGAPRIEWDKVHDTLYLIALHDPYAASFSLKPSAERILGIKPKERDELRDWILENVHGATKSNWGAFISKAPGRLVGAYADGDGIRTEKLFIKLYKDILNRGMQEAYDRERRLMPIMLKSERAGVRMDLRALEHDVPMYELALEWCDNWLRKKLHTPNLNVDADAEVADALDRAGVVTEWVPTATGRRSVSRKNLTLDMFNNKLVAAVHGYRSRLATCLSMFMRTWLETARESGGLMFTNWNQVRQTHGDNKKNAGARTGRLSCSPPLMNIPKAFGKQRDADFGPYLELIEKKFAAFLPPLPKLRKYFLPDKGERWGRRDYNQQELRLLAHFEDGELMQMYNEDPRLDIHKLVQDAILEYAHIHLDRDPTKIINFSDIYGKGLGALAKELKIDVATVKRLKAAKNRILPGAAELMREVQNRGKAGLAIRTWGSREYYTEPAHFSKKFGRVMSFEYKLLNYLVQGSAADVTKESIIRYHNHPKKRGRFILTVHDENDISAPPKVFKQEMLLLRDVMQSIECDVPMLSDGEGGPNWGTLEKLKED